MPQYLLRCRSRALKDRFSYSLWPRKPDIARIATLDFDHKVFEVPEELSLAQAIVFVEKTQGAYDSIGASD